MNWQLIFYNDSLLVLPSDQVLLQGFKKMNDILKPWHRIYKNINTVDEHRKSEYIKAFKYFVEYLVYESNAL